MTSMDDIVQWLETLPDLTVDAKLVNMREAVLVLSEESPRANAGAAALWRMGAGSEDGT